MSPPVVLRRLEKIRADWIGYYHQRLEERCGQDPQFQLVKEDPTYLLRRWGEFKKYFEPLRKTRLGRFLDIRNAIINDPVPKEFFETLTFLDSLKQSLQAESILAPIQGVREYSARSGRLCLSDRIHQIFSTSAISGIVGMFTAVIYYSSPLAGVLMASVGASVTVNSYRLPIRYDPNFNSYHKLGKSINGVIQKLQVLYPPKDLCPSAARTINLLSA